MSNYPGLGFDPAPGEPSDAAAALDAIADAGSQLSTLVAEVDTALDLSAGWKGQVADTFHDNLDDIPPALGKGAESMGKAVAALEHWVQRLIRHRSEAEALDKLAVELKHQIEIAEEVAAAAVSGARMARGSQADAAAEAANAAVAKVASLHKQLDVVIEKARELQREHLLDAKTTADLLNAAKGDAFETPGGGAQALGSVGATVSQISVWTGRAAVVAAAVGIVFPPAGAVAGGLTLASGVTGVTGAAAQGAAKGLGDPKLAGKSYLSLGAEGALSVVPARAGKATTNLVRALHRPLYNYRVGRVTAEVARGAGARQAGREAAEAAKRFGKDAFERTTLGEAVKTYKNVHGYDRVSEAVEEIGKLKVKEVAERGAAETALDKLLEEKYMQELKERTK